MRDFKSPSRGWPVGRLRATAVLHVVFTATAPPGDREAEALLGCLLSAPGWQLHLSDVVREVGPRADAVVARLLDYPLADATLIWRDCAGRLVYVGQRPQNPVLPQGQSWWRGGLDINDYVWNSRPVEAVPA